jgi:hypothetical protein
MKGTKVAISRIWKANDVMEKPALYVGTQIANTTNDSVSDITVASTVMTMGSSRISPSRDMTGNARSVCEASSEPMTSA